MAKHPSGSGRVRWGADDEGELAWDAGPPGTWARLTPDTPPGRGWAVGSPGADGEECGHRDHELVAHHVPGWHMGSKRQAMGCKREGAEPRWQETPGPGGGTRGAKTSCLLSFIRSC